VPNLFAHNINAEGLDSAKDFSLDHHIDSRRWRSISAVCDELEQFVAAEPAHGIGPRHRRSLSGGGERWMRPVHAPMSLRTG
jgi:hypothetical protein